MPFIVFFSVSFIADEVLYTMSLAAGIYYFVDVPLLGAVLSDYRSWSGQFTVWEEEGVIWNVSF